MLFASPVLKERKTTKRNTQRAHSGLCLFLSLPQLSLPQHLVPLHDRALRPLPSNTSPLHKDARAHRHRRWLVLHGSRHKKKSGS